MRLRHCSPHASTLQTTPLLTLNNNSPYLTYTSACSTSLPVVTEFAMPTLSRPLPQHPRITGNRRNPPPNHVALDDPPPLLAAANTQQKRPRPNDPSLHSTWSHRAWLTMGSTSILISLAKSTASSIQSHALVEPPLAALLAYSLSDLASGVYHWAVDNYGSAHTPIFGPQIHAFQGHHKYPWTITKRQFSNNLHALARAVFFAVLPFDLFLDGDPFVHAFVGVFSACIVLSQQFHAWAHCTKSRLPPLVVALQEAGVLVDPAMHGAHHRPPFNNNYCIVSGAWNGALDELRVFEVLEMVLFLRFGVRPRSWSEPDVEWAEEVD